MQTLPVAKRFRSSALEGKPPYDREHYHPFLSFFLMFSDNSDSTASADRLIHLHGDRVRQAVVDEMVRAIRAHDITAAKRWDQIGQEVDRKLAALSTTNATA